MGGAAGDIVRRVLFPELRSWLTNYWKALCGTGAAPAQHLHQLLTTVAVQWTRVPKLAVTLLRQMQLKLSVAVGRSRNIASVLATMDDRYGCAIRTRPATWTPSSVPAVDIFICHRQQTVCCHRCSDRRCTTNSTALVRDVDINVCVPPRISNQMQRRRRGGCGGPGRATLGHGCARICVRVGDARSMRGNDRRPMVRIRLSDRSTKIAITDQW
jgi:hypothetical protein